MINQHWAILRILDRLFHIADDALFVVGDDHGPTAKHVGWPDQNGVSDALGAFDRFFNRSSHRAWRLRDIEFFEELVETFSVFGQVDRLGRRDRKSTRLNSSHVAISYAVFCLKKKNQPTTN